MVSALEFRQELFGGTTRPLVLSCEGDNGERNDFAVKLKTGRSGVYGLCCEWIASHLASLLHIPVVEPDIVNITQEFIDTIPVPNIVDRLNKSLGLNFGSRLLTGGYSTWLSGKPLTAALRIPACEILGFDVLVQNSDRRAEKPNVLWRENELIILDHELAFPFPFVIGCVDPWNDLFTLGIRKHIFFQELRTINYPIERFRGALEAITDNDFNSLFDLIPEEWIEADRIRSLREYLPRRRDSAGRWIDSIRSELQ